MKSSISLKIIIFLLPVLMFSCSKEDNPVTDHNKFLKIADITTSGSSFDISFYSPDSLFVGYNKVYFKIIDKSTNQTVTQANIVLHPLMDMVTFSHACPFENPLSTINSDGYFEGAVMFSMEGNNYSWSLSADVTANGKTETAQFPIKRVRPTSPVKKIVVIDSLSTGPGTWAITKYPVSLVQPPAWKVGNNPFEITVHKMASMMSFPCCTDFTIEITPEMPSMGHGSPNNVNPVSTGNGHYSGVVNFTMTGAWRINMVFKIGDRTISRRAYFDIVF